MPPSVPLPVLGEAERSFVEAARRAVLATIADDGRPRPMVVCFAIVEVDALPLVVSPLDDKPKRVRDVLRLARVRDILARPAVSLLVDRWDEDWSKLGWVRLDGEARLLEPTAEPALHADAVGALRRRYAQYRGHRLESAPIIAVSITAVRTWGMLEPDARSD